MKKSLFEYLVVKSLSNIQLFQLRKFVWLMSKMTQSNCKIFFENSGLDKLVSVTHPLLKFCTSMTEARSVKCVILVTYQSPRWHWEARRCCVTGLTYIICQMLSDSWSSRDNVIKSAGCSMWVNKRLYYTPLVFFWFFFLSFIFFSCSSFLKSTWKLILKENAENTS